MLAVEYGGYDGAHHKDWVIDQMLRRLMEPERYKKMVEACGGSYDEGIAP